VGEADGVLASSLRNVIFTRRSDSTIKSIRRGEKTEGGLTLMGVVVTTVEDGISVKDLNRFVCAVGSDVSGPGGGGIHLDVKNPSIEANKGSFSGSKTST
jgi:hypothetical protein